MCTDATRGAGRPEATHLIEMMVEQLAHELGMDSLELRRKNFIPKEDFPAEVAVGIVYDSGDYHGSLDKLLTHVDLDAFRREQEELRAKGIHRGIGFSTWMEICGLAPSRAVGPMRRRPAVGLLRVLARARARDGRGDRLHGTAPHGQGLDTAFAQIVADRLGISPGHGRRRPRRHGHRPVRPRHLRLALAGRRRRVDRPLDREAGREGQEDRRAQPRGRARGHRAQPTASSPSRARRTRASRSPRSRAPRT